MSLARAGGVVRALPVPAAAALRRALLPVLLALLALRLLAEIPGELRQVPALVAIAGAASAAWALRVVRLRLLLDATGHRLPPIQLLRVGAWGLAAAAAFLPLVGRVVEAVLLVRRGVRSRDAGAVALVVALWETVAALALGGGAALVLYRGDIPAFVAPAYRAALLPLALLALALAGLALLPRALDLRLPVAARDADATPRAIARRALGVASGHAGLMAGVLTAAAVVVEAAAFGMAGVAMGAGGAAGLLAGLARVPLLLVPPLLRTLHPDALLAGALASAAGVAPTAASALSHLATPLVVAWPLVIAAGVLALVRPEPPAPTAADARLFHDERTQVAAVVAGALLLRVLAMARGSPYAWPDARDHDAYVLHVLAGNLVPLAPEFFMAYHPPFGYWLMAPFRLLLGPAGHVVLNLSLSVATLLAANALLHRLALPRPWRMGSLVVLALLPTQVGLAVNATNDMLATLLGALLLLAAWPLLEGRARTRDGAAFGVLVAVSALTKFNLIVPAVGLGFFALVASRGRPTRPLVAAVLAGALALPWYARNALLLGAPAVSNMAYFDMPFDPGYFEPAFLAPTWAFLLAPPATTDFWGLLAESAFWSGAYLPPSMPVYALLGGLSGLRTLHLLVGLAVTLLAAVGAAVAVGRGTLQERALVAIAITIVLSQVAYFATYPTYHAVKGYYLNPGLVAFLAIAARGGIAVRETLSRWGVSERGARA